MAAILPRGRGMKQLWIVPLLGFTFGLVQLVATPITQSCPIPFNLSSSNDAAHDIIGKLFPRVQ